jgi:hypothetical protein
VPFPPARGFCLVHGHATPNDCSSIPPSCHVVVELAPLHLWLHRVTASDWPRKRLRSDHIIDELFMSQVPLSEQVGDDDVHQPAVLASWSFPVANPMSSENILVWNVRDLNSVTHCNALHSLVAAERPSIIWSTSYRRCCSEPPHAKVGSLLP